MKHCPTCNRTYADDSQQFCLQDGTPLSAGAPSASAAHGAAPPPPSWQQPPAKKRKIWPWVLGGLVLLLVGGVVLIAVLGVVIYKLADTNTNSVVRTSTNARSNSNANAAEEVAVDTANTELYVNSRDKFTGTLAANYMDFSFRYPDTWKLDPDPAPSYVRVERTGKDGYAVENFSVGWFATNGPSAVGNTTLLSQVINNFGSQVSGNFPGYTKVGEGSTTVGRYSGYELRFNGAVKQGASKELPYWGRVVILPDPAGSKYGVSFIMVASGHSSEVKGQADVGEKGELPVILKTFKFGPASGANSNSNTTDDDDEL